MTVQVPSLTDLLLNWYDANRRALPWRYSRASVPDPYHVWLSEVMLQQTTVATVKPRYARFLERWPDVSQLAKAPQEDVLHEWQGLGYYARARNLHRCAQTVHREFNGVFPSTEEELRTLPGIGEYTAAAIAAIAFGQVTAPVDGNIIRVISRLNAIEDIMPKGKAVVREYVQQLVSRGRAGDIAQAMMDLGSAICTPKRPACHQCPWSNHCIAGRLSDPAVYPKKASRKQKPTRHGVVFWMTNDREQVYLRRRPAKGLLGSMMEFPSTEWEANPRSTGDAFGQAPYPVEAWTVLNGEVTHTFTHFHLRLTVACGRVNANTHHGNGHWSLPEDFHRQALPTVMKKVAEHVAQADRQSHVA